MEEKSAGNERKRLKYQARKNGGVRTNVKFFQSGKESPLKEKQDVSKGVELEQGNEQNDTLDCA